MKSKIVQVSYTTSGKAVCGDICATVFGNVVKGQPFIHGSRMYTKTTNACGLRLGGGSDECGCIHYVFQNRDLCIVAGDRGHFRMIMIAITALQAVLLGLNSEEQDAVLRDLAVWRASNE